MADISEAAKAKACELVDAEPESRVPSGYLHAFARYIQQVSDAVSGYIDNRSGKHPLAPFILPDPKDELAEALDEIWPVVTGPSCAELATALRANLAKRGLEIREIAK